MSFVRRLPDWHGFLLRYSRSNQLGLFARAVSDSRCSDYELCLDSQAYFQCSFRSTKCAVPTTNVLTSSQDETTRVKSCPLYCDFMSLMLMYWPGLKTCLKSRSLLVCHLSRLWDLCRALRNHIDELRSKYWRAHHQHTVMTIATR